METHRKPQAPPHTKENFEGSDQGAAEGIGRAENCEPVQDGVGTEAGEGGKEIRPGEPSLRRCALRKDPQRRRNYCGNGDRKGTFPSPRDTGQEALATR